MFTQLTEQLTNQFTTAMKSFSDTAQVETAMKPLNSLVELNTKEISPKDKKIPITLPGAGPKCHDPSRAAAREHRIQPS